MSAYLASLASLCLSLVAKVFALVDDLAMRIPPSCCPICQFNSLRESHLKTRDKNTMLVFNPATEVHSLKKLEDIDVEKAIYPNLLPGSAQSTQAQLPRESKVLAPVHLDDDDDDVQSARKKRIKPQPPLVNAFYTMPRGAGTQTTIISPYVASSSSTTRAATPSITQPPSSSQSYAHPAAFPHTHGDQQQHQQQPAELPAARGSSIGTQQHPVELPADEVSPLLPPAQPVPSPPPPPTPPPKLRIPRPRSPAARKASPLLLAPPPVGVGTAELRSSCGSSLGSETIQIGLWAELC